MHSTYLLLISTLLLPLSNLSCKKSKAGEATDSGKQCKSMLADKVSRAVVIALVKEKSDLSGEQLMELEDAELLPLCKAVPERVLRCNARFDLESPACSAAIDAYLGLTDSTPKASGPQPLWSVAIEKRWLDAIATEEGTVVMAYPTKVVAWSAGTELWVQPMSEDYSGRLAAFSNCVLAPTATELRCLDFKDGKDLWSATRPEGESSMITSIATHKSRALFVGDAGKVQSLLEGDCAKKNCIHSTGITVDPFADGQSFTFSDSGQWMLGEDNRLRLFSAQDKELWSRAGYESDVPSTDGKSFAVLSGKELLKVDPKACESSPKTCAAQISLIKEEYAGNALILPGGNLALAEEYGVIASHGSKTWSIDVGNDGDLLVHGQQLMSVGHRVGLTAGPRPPLLRAINPQTGGTDWMTELPGKSSGLHSATLLSAGPSTIVVVDSVNDKLHWLKTDLN